MRISVIFASVLLAGCAVLERPAPVPDAEPEIVPTEGDSGLRPLARPNRVADASAAADIPVTGSAIPDATLPPPAGASGTLGRTIASLGDPGEGGMWLDTPLVDVQRPGQVSYNGNVVALTLRPSGGAPGAGSEISLRAMQALGAPITELVEITVEAF
jgi:hypothetical protein